MVKRIDKRIEGLAFDDDGLADGMQIMNPEYHARGSSIQYSSIQDLLVDWLPSTDEGGYAAFIGENGLQGVLPEVDLERLFTDTNTRMGKNLAGFLSLLVPTEYCTWRKFKYVYDRGVKQNHKEEIDILDDAPQQFIEDFASTEGLEFGHLLRMLRRFDLSSLKELGARSGLSKARINKYETGSRLPGVVVVHKLCDALKVNKDLRMLMLSTAEKNVFEKLENEKEWSDGLKSITGGGSIFGALLVNLRSDKGWSSTKLAREAGIDVVVVSRYERGKTSPNFTNTNKLCDALNVDKGMRMLLLDAAGKNARAELEDADTWRVGLQSIIGAGNIFGALLVNLREEKGFTQTQLAEACGVGQSQVASYEAGKDFPSHANIHKICDALEADKDTRMLLLDVSGKGARAKSEDPERWREGLKSIIGGGSVFGALLVNLREEKGFTQTQLAEACGVTRQAVASYEAGKDFPSHANIHKICNALEVDNETRELLEQVVENARETRKSAKKLGKGR